MGQLLSEVGVLKSLSSRDPLVGVKLKHLVKQVQVLVTFIREKLFPGCLLCWGEFLKLFKKPYVFPLCIVIGCASNRKNPFELIQWVVP